MSGIYKFKKTLMEGDCSKICYPTRKIAKQKSKGISRQFGIKHRVYKCPKCLGFHLTTQEKGNRLWLNYLNQQTLQKTKKA